MKIRLLVIVALLLSVLLTSEGASALRELQEGMEIPPFSISDASGKISAYKELAGKKGTLLIFWQTTTKNSARALETLQQKYPDWQQKGLQVLAISVEKQNISDEDVKTIKAVVDRLKLSFPLFIDRGLNVFDKFGVIALPTMVLVDDKMVIQKEMSGFPLAGSQVFLEEVGYFLGEKRAVAAKETYRPPKQATLAFQLGFRFESKRNPEKALELYEKALSIDPAYASPYVRMTDIYIRSGQFPAAKALLAKIPKNLLENPPVMTSLGKVYFHENDMAGAKKMFTESLAREEIPDTYVYLGFLYHHEGNVQEAEKAFTGAAGLSANSPEVLQKIGRFFSAKGEYVKANEYYKRALENILLNDAAK